MITASVMKGLSSFLASDLIGFGDIFVKRNALCMNTFVALVLDLIQFPLDLDINSTYIRHVLCTLCTLNLPAVPRVKFSVSCNSNIVSPLSANSTKWSKTLKLFVGNSQRIV